MEEEFPKRVAEAAADGKKPPTRMAVRNEIARRMLKDAGDDVKANIKEVVEEEASRAKSEWGQRHNSKNKSAQDYHEYVTYALQNAFGSRFL